ncbi:uncharacterized protein LOC135166941 [Diachasmimorpha longicaudata]|uniref:uncharacterized protein LOC135166941 n=1 Tax=Diachasmimorpha longicaudata TaxID=58733 RepID=UPI0030B8B3F8
MKCFVFSLLLCVLITFSTAGSPKVIIIGAGPSGIAAASRLLQNGINDVTILEAEDRYGGRIKKTEIGEYSTDLGAQWVHGEDGNVANELAAPLGLLSKQVASNVTDLIYDCIYFESSGTKLPEEVTQGFFQFGDEIKDHIIGVDDQKNTSFGEYMRKRLDEWFTKHPAITPELQKPLTHSMELEMTAIFGAEHSDDVSVVGVKNAPSCPGFRDLNWKERTYGTILEILMKRYPNPEEELPVLNKTLLNKKVTKINYAEEGPVKVTSADGEEYTADHVIFTPSLGVLKANHEQLFEPQLPEKNRKAIEALGMGRNGKILLYDEEPWWNIEGHWALHNFVWTEDDRKVLENDPEKAWMLGVTYGFPVEYKPKLYQIWLSGPHLDQMERLPQELFRNQTLELIQRFFGKTYNVTEPTEIQRTSWNTNENFRGTYSYPTIQSETAMSGATELGEPVIHGGIPVLSFAGEATEPRYFSMVHGAIASGWREADRLINLYRQQNSNPKVIVIGAGAAGIAAASKLLQNGFDDVIILEAEDRYGGRIYSTKIGEYWGDLGAQWVHGTEGNVVHELASPLGLLSTARGPEEPEEPPFQVKLCGSSGSTLPADVTQGVLDHITNIMHNYTGLEDLKTGSMGEYIETRFNDWFKKHPEISDELRKSLLHNVKLMTLSEEGADDWNKVSVFGSKDAPACSGFSEINWKERTYDTIFNILIKQYPNPEDELSVLNKTFLNKKVSKINYAGDGQLRVMTTDGWEYMADHVIFTASLGVLKADHEKIFQPPLPENNRNAIERIGMGRNAKILMYYENPWWKPRKHTLNSFYWTEEDRKEIENNPKKNWLLGIIDDSIVEYKPKLYLLWISGPYAEEMERIPDEQFQEQIMEFLRKFFGSTYNITEPTKIVRSFWNTNDNFWGTYSYQTPQSVKTNVGPRDLGAPIMRKGVPILQFAGEATDPAHFSTVHGAIASGWREADRLINFYNGNPKVIIVGAGAAGIAAASKLMQNGIDDLIILEAENRYGGRVNSIKIGEYWADLGAQWVHGVEGNVAYELAWPLGLLSKSRGPGEPEEFRVTFQLRESSGNLLSEDINNAVTSYGEEVFSNITGIENLKTGSYGEYFETRFNNWFENHPEISVNLRKSLMNSMELMTMASEGSDDWHKVSIAGSEQAPPCAGFNEVNWKDRAYRTILEIMMKKYPNPEDELPVLNKTFLNKKVSKVNYADEGPVKVTTADGTEYTADHVIFTTSLGVLKADHAKIFEPALPEINKNAIERLGMGKNAKILMYYETPWWESRGNVSNAFYWTEEDRKEMENDPDKNWLLGIAYDSIVEYKPKLYFLWMSGPYAEQMERIPDEQFKNQTMEFLRKFLGKTGTVTEPTEIRRSSWNTNENFRGSYSYPTMQSFETTRGPRDLGTPVMRKGIPVVQFAGEATDPPHYANVHGAIASGWREADRLINLYSKE